MEVKVYAGKMDGRDIYEFRPIMGPANRDPEGNGFRKVDFAETPSFKLSVPNGSEICPGRKCATAIRVPGRQAPIDADDAVNSADEHGFQRVELS
jgi:hypothetical protein